MQDEDPIKILQGRYARGEITKEQYFHKLNDIQNQRQSKNFESKTPSASIPNLSKFQKFILLVVIFYILVTFYWLIFINVLTLTPIYILEIILGILTIFFFINGKKVGAYIGIIWSTINLFFNLWQIYLLLPQGAYSDFFSQFMTLFTINVIIMLILIIIFYNERKNLL